jgi:hypothetical protein
MGAGISADRNRGLVVTHGVRQRILFGCVASALLLSGCMVHHPSAVAKKMGASSSPPRTIPSSAPLTDTPWQDPAKALTNSKVWVTTGRRSGGVQLPLPAKPAGGTIWVATECQGTGTLTVDTGWYGTYTEQCSDRPDGSLNAFEAVTPETATRLKVAAEPRVIWAVAVGLNPSRNQP